MNSSRLERGRRLARSGLVAIAAIMAGCSSSPSAPEPERITICGRVERVVRDESAASGLVLRDARSGSPFVLAIPASARTVFERELGKEPEIVLEGQSVCATGKLDGRTLEVDSPGDLKINAPME
jgi:hypothetical protein